MPLVDHKKRNIYEACGLEEVPGKLSKLGLNLEIQLDRNKTISEAVEILENLVTEHGRLGILVIAAYIQLVIRGEIKHKEVSDGTV